MHQAEHDRYNLELLNDYYECDIREREVRGDLVREYREWETGVSQ